MHTSSPDTNLTQLFSDPVLPAFKVPWSRESYGLTTFAAAPPLRCFGVDSETPYDVAVLGMRHYCATPQLLNLVDHFLYRRTVRHYYKLPTGVSGRVPCLVV